MVIYSLDIFILSFLLHVILFLVICIMARQAVKGYIKKGFRLKFYKYYMQKTLHRPFADLAGAKVNLGNVD